MRTRAIKVEVHRFGGELRPAVGAFIVLFSAIMRLHCATVPTKGAEWRYHSLANAHDDAKSSTLGVDLAPRYATLARHGATGASDGADQTRGCAIGGASG